MIKPLELNVPHQMDGFSVTLIEANHVPGSVMFLFEGPKISDGVVLCTGDFRADFHFYTNIYSMNILQEKVIGTLYLDNTYLNVNITEFPTREESLEKTVNLIKSSNPNQLFAISVNNIGREKFIHELAKSLQENIYVPPLRQQIAELLGLHEYLKTDPRNIRIRTCHKRDYITLMFTGYSIISPSMAFHLNSEIARNKLIKIGYSDHSSPNEIRDFLRLLRFKKVVGTVNCIQPSLNLELLSLSLTINNDSITTSGDCDKEDISPFSMKDFVGKFQKDHQMPLSEAEMKNLSQAHPIDRFEEEMVKILGEVGPVERNSDEVSNREAMDFIDSILSFNEMTENIYKEIGKHRRIIPCSKVKKNEHLNEHLNEFEKCFDINKELAEFSKVQGIVYKRKSQACEFSQIDTELVDDMVIFDAYNGPVKITPCIRKASSNLSQLKKNTQRGSKISH